MASSAIIGALRVVLGLDTASFEDGLKKSTKKTDDFATSVKKIAAGIGLERIIEKSLTAVFDTIVGGFKRSVDGADELSKAAQKAGTSVEALSGLKFAAELSDVSFEQLVGGFGKLSKAMQEAQLGSDKAQASFAALGVAIREGGKFRDVSEVFLDIAEKFRGMQDGAAKTALAMRIFGKAGAELIPLLNEGRGNIEEFIKTAKRMGLVISTETAGQAQKYNDNMKVLSAATQGFANKITEAVLPAMVRFTNAMVKNAETGETTTKWAEVVVTGLKNVTRWALVAVEAMTILKNIAALQITLFSRPKDFLEDLGKIKEQILAFPVFVAKTGGDVEAMFDKMGAGAKGASKEVNLLGQSIDKAIKDLKFKTEELKGTFDHLPEGFPAAAQAMGMSIEQIRMAMVNGSKATRDWIAAFAEFNAAKAIDTGKSTYEKDTEAIDKLRVSLVLAGRTGAEQAEIIGKSAAKMASSWKNAVTDITQNLATGFANLASVNKKFAGIAKAAAYAQAIWSTYSGAAKALELYGPTPLGFAAAAAAVVAGLGYVAKIQAQEFAKGGSFMVPGGRSGVDSKFVPLNLSPGERVEIKPAEQSATGGASTTIELRGRRLGDLMTFEDMRDLIDGLNAAHRDGYRLKLTTV